MIKLVRNFLLYILLPSFSFAECFYLNDIFNVDLFNLKKIDLLEEKIESLSNKLDIVANKNESNAIDVDNNNNYIQYAMGTIFLTAFLYILYSFFTGGSASDIAAAAANQLETHTSVSLKTNAELHKETAIVADNGLKSLYNGLSNQTRLLSELHSDNSRNIIDNNFKGNLELLKQNALNLKAISEIPKNMLSLNYKNLTYFENILDKLNHVINYLHNNNINNITNNIQQVDSSNTLDNSLQSLPTVNDSTTTDFVTPTVENVRNIISDSPNLMRPEDTIFD